MTLLKVSWLHMMIMELFGWSSAHSHAEAAGLTLRLTAFRTSVAKQIRTFDQVKTYLPEVHFSQLWRDKDCKKVGPSCSL
jgi:hypothetical protein